MQIQFTEEEMQDRLGLARKIMEGARSIRSLPPLEEKAAQDAALAWEAAFAGIATQQLPEVYRLGLRHKCTTAAEFQAVWEMKMEAESRVVQHRQTVKQLDAMEGQKPVPQYILDKLPKTRSVVVGR